MLYRPLQDCSLRCRMQRELVKPQNSVVSEVFSEAPPISQKRTLAFINHFIITTVSFLNQFMMSCESKLQKFDQRMQRLEASLCILEAKLSSIPGLEVEVSSVPVPLVEKTRAQQPETQELLEVEGNNSLNSAENEQPNVAEESAPKEENPLIMKYKKMIHVGVPAAAVKMKMRQEGVDPDLLDQ